MAIVNWLNTDLFSAYRTKINDTFDFLKSGTAGQRLKGVASGSDPVWYTPATDNLIINIGDWNMDTTQDLTVPHGIADFKKIRSIKVMIRNDADDSYKPLDCVISSSNNKPMGGVISFDSTNVYLTRGTDPSGFNNTDYNSTSYNRGYIIIEYAL